MSSATAELTEAITAGAPRSFFSAFTPPETMRAAALLRSEAAGFAGLASEDKDPRKSLHVMEVPVPRPGPGEALVAVLAAGLNHNTVWSSRFEPDSGFTYLDRLALQGGSAARHALDYHILGSDAAGVVVELGEGPSRFQPGDHVTICPTYLENPGMSQVDDTMADPGLRAWGFETNFGALAEFALVKVVQLLPKPRHLTWEEAASLQLVSATCYRMLVGTHGAQMRQGDIVLVWGAAGGLGCMAAQYVRHGGGVPVCVVSSPQKKAVLHAAGYEAVIDRAAEGYQFLDNGVTDVKECGRFRRRIRQLAGEDPDIVFEHTGRQTFPASVFVPKKSGRVVTCASTSGYQHTYDNRFLWMNLRRIIGSHGGTYEESLLASRLSCRGLIHPTLSRTVELSDVAEAVAQMHRGEHLGKIGVLSLAGRPGLGVTDEATRVRLIGDITRFQTAVASVASGTAPAGAAT
ncbi:MAG TPA: crotonyl-CoA carboxylase/reductase [Streptosporangiaceae bacterium]|nr:crotonyl-CoA carboxylase/reductase [Streptosporangiaceae bacterium]